MIFQKAMPRIIFAKSVAPNRGMKYYLGEGKMQQLKRLASMQSNYVFSNYSALVTVLVMFTLW